MNYDNFKESFMRVLERHAPMKTKMVRGNNAPFMNKTFSKAFWVLQVTNLNGLPHSLLSYGHLIPGERACSGRTCMIKKFFQGPSKGRYIPWAVPEDSGYWLSGVLRGWSANG